MWWNCLILVLHGHSNKYLYKLVSPIEEILWHISVHVAPLFLLGPAERNACPSSGEGRNDLAFWGPIAIRISLLILLYWQRLWTLPGWVSIHNLSEFSLWLGSFFLFHTGDQRESKIFHMIMLYHSILRLCSLSSSLSPIFFPEEVSAVLLSCYLRISPSIDWVYKSFPN